MKGRNICCNYKHREKVGIQAIKRKKCLMQKAMQWVVRLVFVAWLVSAVFLLF